MGMGQAATVVHQSPVELVDHQCHATPLAQALSEMKLNEGKKSASTSKHVLKIQGKDSHAQA